MTLTAIADTLEAALKNQLKIIGDYQILVVENSNDRIVQKMRKIKDSLVYRKNNYSKQVSLFHKYFNSTKIKANAYS